MNLNQVKTFSLTHPLLAIPLGLPDFLALFKCPYLRTSFVFGATIGFPNVLLVSVGELIIQMTVTIQDSRLYSIPGYLIYIFLLAGNTFRDN